MSLYRDVKKISFSNSGNPVTEKDIFVSYCFLFDIDIVIKKTLDLVGRGFLERLTLNDD